MTQGLQPARWRLTRAAVFAAFAAMAVVVMETHGVGQTSGIDRRRAAPSDVRFMTLGPGPLPRRAGAEGDVSGRLAAGRRLRAARPRPARPPGPRQRLQPPRRRRRPRGPRRPRRARLPGRMLREKPGNVVVLSGRNRRQDRPRRRLARRRPHVLADKPWILASADLPKLDARARRGGSPQAGRLRHHDRALRDHVDACSARWSRTRRSSATIVPGTPAEPGVYMESVHHLMKVVVGRAEHPADLVLRRRRSRARASTTSARTWSIWCSGRCCPERAVDAGRTSRCSAPTAGRR